MRIVSVFKSVRLALALILILAASSVIGTLLPQELPPHRGVERYGEKAYQFLEFLGVFDLYHSVWFVCLVFLLAANIVVCSLSRVRRTYQLTAWKGSEERTGIPSGLPVRRTLKSREPPDVLRGRLSDGLGRLGLRLRSRAQDDLRADRGRLGRWGPELTHLGFLVIIAGMLIGSLTGFRGRMDLVEGEKADVVLLWSGETVTLPFEVRCDDFEVTFYDGSSRPKEYTSWVSVIEAGRDLLVEKIEVNDPLKYRGYWLYQSSYGRIGPAPGEEWVELMIHPEGVGMDLALGERKPIEGTEGEVELLRFEPDFVMDAHGEVTSRSQELRNPAAQIRVYQSGEPLYSQWVFAEFPQFHPPDGAAHLLHLASFSFREFTGLQVTYDPGVPVVWVGCGFLILGLLLSFTVSHRRVWARVETVGDGSIVKIAAGARRDLRRFEESIDELLNSLGGRNGREEGAGS